LRRRNDGSLAAVVKYRIDWRTFELGKKILNDIENWNYDDTCEPQSAKACSVIPSPLSRKPQLA